MQKAKDRELGFDPCCVSYFSNGEYLVVSGTDRRARCPSCLFSFSRMPKLAQRMPELSSSSTSVRGLWQCCGENLKRRDSVSQYKFIY